MARVLFPQPFTSPCCMQKWSQITLQLDFLWCINMCRVRRFFSQRMAHMQCLNIFAPSFGHLIRSLRVSPRTSDRICTKMCPEGGLQTAGLEGHVLVTFSVTLCAWVLSLKPRTLKSDAGVMCTSAGTPRPPAATPATTVPRRSIS